MPTMPPCSRLRISTTRAKGLKLILTITPIHTNVKVTPSDLKNKTLDDPEVIERYKKLLEFVFAKLPDVELSSLVIGSEMDVYFGEDKNLWAQYLNFFSEVFELYPCSKT